MNDKLKAIDTVYRGYKFRSRLEARWAVFFDAIGVEWRYEDEGYSYGDIYYLPDFYLPELDCFVEIKPDIKEALEFINITDKTVYVFHQIPDPTREVLSGCRGAIAKFDSDSGEDEDYFWCECRDCGAVGIQFNGRADRLACKKDSCQRSEHGDKGYNYDSPKLLAGYKAARSARFEHGQKPVVYAP